jgi:hypothetical protein
MRLYLPHRFHEPHKQLPAYTAFIYLPSGFRYAPKGTGRTAHNQVIPVKPGKINVQHIPVVFIVRVVVTAYRPRVFIYFKGGVLGNAIPGTFEGNTPTGNTVK